MVNKVLITGGSGLLGGNLVMMMEDEFVMHAIANEHQMKFKTCQVHQLDITHSEDLLSLVKKIDPQWIIHTAALTSVDYCEVNKDHAWKVNVEGTKNIVAAAKTTHSKLVYISTDSVFDGEKGMYTEKDLPNPLNFYALTKLEGEKAVCQSNVSYIIIRTNIYGWNARNKSSIAEWMLTSLRDKKKLTLFSDVFFSPILVNNLSDVIIEMLRKDLSGLFHVAGSERCSKLKFGLKLAEIFDLDRNLIEAVTLSEKNLVARRPIDPSLSTEKVRSEIETDLLNVAVGLKAFKNLSDSGYVRDLRKCAL